jgi:outer membrane biosynthesis protein TonB
VFENLIESSGKRRKSFVESLVSLLVHGAIIVGAIKVTQGVAEEIKERPIDTTLVFLKPPEATPPPPEPPPADIVVSANPPPKGFQTVVPPDVIPKDIPPVDLNAKPFNPSDFTGKGVEGGIATGVVGGTGPVEVKAEVFMSSQLDDPAVPVSQPEPRFPPVLQSAGIGGHVVIQYIVDTTGHAEPGSIKILEKTHDAFVAPARETILKSVYKPAKFKGDVVRQLVQQKISFKAPGT